MIGLKRENARDKASTNSATEFVVHKSLLYYFSKFFKNALDGNFSEAGKDIFAVTEGSRRILEQFVGWLYTGKIKQTPNGVLMTSKLYMLSTVN